MKSLLVVILISVSSYFVLDDPILYPSELNTLTVGPWKGKLTYIDYTSNKETIIPADLTVVASDTNPSQWNFFTAYPDEPHMNNTSVVNLTNDGKEFDGEVITEKKFSDGVLYFVTEREGEDNNRKALIRHIHTLTDSEFRIRKEVKFDGEDNYSFRNEYLFTR